MHIPLLCFVNYVFYHEVSLVITPLIMSTNTNYNIGTAIIAILPVILVYSIESIP